MSLWSWRVFLTMLIDVAILPFVRHWPSDAFHVTASFLVGISTALIAIKVSGPIHRRYPEG